MSYKYNPYRDTFTHIDDEEPITAWGTGTTPAWGTGTAPNVSAVLVQSYPVGYLADECIERIAEAVVRKINEEEKRMRLIDAGALIAEMHNVILEDGDDRSIFYEVIERQPTIDPVKWISCKERLPEANGRYLVTRGLNACGALWNRVYIINYSDLMGLKSERIWWDGNVGKSDFEVISDVIAWMPLPKPWRGEEE